LVLKADYILTMDNEILENAKIEFDTKIKRVGYFKKEAEYLGENSVIMPALINPHTHLEFSNNKTTLAYGDFLEWLESVIENREECFFNCKANCYKKAIDEMIDSGICAFGEISSSANDLKYLLNSPLKVIYFNEILGLNPAAVDAIFADFKARVNEALAINNEKFYCGISIHSPYSTHPILMDKAIEIAKENNLPIQTHFMESKYERLWLDKEEGGFKIFFEKYFKHARRLISSTQFLNKFKDTNTTFVHAVYANDKELEIISSLNANIAHCPISNRLLNVGVLDLEKVKNYQIDYLVATDGLSSNYSLNLFKELRAALLIHTQLHPRYLAKDLLKSVTINAAKALKLNNGILKENKDADIITFKLPNRVKNLEELPLHIILHTNSVDRLYINGELIKK